MDNYKELQNLVKEYEKTEIWKYVDGDDIFKIEGFDEKIYVSIMGKAGIDCSVAIYCGDQDLLSQLDISFGQYVSSPDAFLRLSAYKIEIGNPGNMLSPEDRKILKKNGIKGKNLVFRLDSGKPPRIVNEKECLLLIDILTRIINIAKFIVDNKFDLDLSNSEDIYIFSEKENEVNVKKAKWPILHYKFIKQRKLDSDLINRGVWAKNDGELNIGMLYAPMFIDETKIYPLMIIIHDEKADIIIDVMIVPENEKADIANKILKSLVEKKMIPSKISFNSNEITDICKDIYEEFDILFRVEENLESIFNIWMDMKINFVRQK